MSSAHDKIVTEGVFPGLRTCPFSAPEEYAELRRNKPVAKVDVQAGKTAWMITRYADVRKMLTEPSISVDPNLPGYPQTRKADPTAAHKWVRPFNQMDPPDHTYHRRMLIPEFTMRRLRAMRPGIREVADKLIDDMLDQGSATDLVSAYSLPLPSLVICQLLGVPYADHEFFQSHTAVMVALNSPEDELVRTSGEMMRYLDDLVAEKEKNPGDDLIGRLVVAKRRTGELSHEQLVGAVILLLLAGHETTANMISLGAFTLLRHPDQLAELRADPELMTGAVEELLRLHSILDLATTRVATEDLEIAGQIIPAGDGVVGPLVAANHDETIFPEPERFDIHRPARHHVAFGYGVHQCIGQNLARVTLEEGYAALINRIPTLRLDAEVDELPFKYGGGVFGLHALPVAW